MTNKEAAEKLKSFYGCETAIELEKAYCNSGDALRMAIEALERQIPKQPYLPVNVDLAANDIDGRCPYCGARQSCGSLLWHQMFNKFCVDCGQPLDWDPNHWSDLCEDLSNT